MRLLSFRKVFKATVAFTVISAILIAISAFIISKLDDPSSVVSLTSLLILGVAAVTAGKISSFGCTNKFVQGLVTGLTVCAILITLSAIFSGYDGMSLLKIFITPVLCVIGAIIGKGNSEQRNLRNRRAKIMRKYRAQ